jgi:hypothetical protein
MCFIHNSTKVSIEFPWTVDMGNGDEIPVYVVADIDEPDGEGYHGSVSCQVYCDGEETTCVSNREMELIEEEAWERYREGQRD